MCTETPQSDRRTIPELTAVKHHLHREEKYGRVDEHDIEFFREILSDDGVVIDEKVIQERNIDYQHKYRGQSSVLLKPSTTKQVSEILKHCNERVLAVVPQGGKTGVVGASVPIFDEIVLSLEKLNKIRAFDEVSGVFTADSGIVLQKADAWLREKGFIFPLDLALKGECQIGGNISTNAGGLRVLRYGSLHGSVLGIEAVLANGEIFDGLNVLRKDNTGYDLKQLFIGSEGTLGVVTGISILAAPQPKSVHVAFLGLESFPNVEKTFVRSRQLVTEILSAFECLDGASLNLAKETHDLKGDPLPHLLDQNHPFSVLLETSGSNKKHDLEKLQTLVETLKQEGLVSEALIASSDESVANVWRWREMVPKLSSYWGGCNAYDVSLPLPAMWKLVDAVKERIVERKLISKTDDSKPVVDVIGYGHIGDGNIHLNVVVRRYDTEVEKAIEPFVYEFVAAHKGSIAAEHGIGFQKLHALELTKSPALIHMMQSLKSLYDPNWILNPYKIFNTPAN